jgi:hypothetical protein
MAQTCAESLDKRGSRRKYPRQERDREGGRHNPSLPGSLFAENKNNPETSTLEKAMMLVPNLR